MVAQNINQIWFMGPGPYACWESKHLNIFWGGVDTGKAWEISGKYRELKETPKDPGKSRDIFLVAYKRVRPCYFINSNQDSVEMSHDKSVS